MPPVDRGPRRSGAENTPCPDAIPLGPWLEHLERHLPVARQGQDPEGVHQVRVAAARLDVWLRLDGRRVLRADLRWLRRTGGVVRDIDVMLARGHPPETEALLKQQRTSAQRLFVSLLGHRRLQALRESLALLPPLQRWKAEQGLEEWSKSALRYGRRTDFTKDPLSRLHRLRRSLRRLRYAREWLGLETLAMHKQVRVLGDLNDLAVLRNRMRAAKAGKRSAGKADLESLGQQIGELRLHAADLWRAVSKEIEE